MSEVTNPIMLDATGQKMAAALERIADVRDEETRAKSAESTLGTQITVETSRAKAAETANANAINDEVDRAKAAETANANAINDEVDRAKAAETANANAITAEQTRAETAEKEISDNLAEVKSTNLERTAYSIGRNPTTGHMALIYHE